MRAPSTGSSAGGTGTASPGRVSGTPISAVRMSRPRPRAGWSSRRARRRVGAMAEPRIVPLEPTTRRPDRWLEWLYALGPVVALTLLGLLTMDRPTVGGSAPTVVLVVLPLAARRLWPIPILVVVVVGAPPDERAIATSLDPGLRRRPGQLHGRRAGRRSDAFRAGRHRPGRIDGRRLHRPGRQPVRGRRPAVRGSRPDVAAGRPGPGAADRRRATGRGGRTVRCANARCASRPPRPRSAGTSPASCTTSSPTPSA